MTSRRAAPDTHRHRGLTLIELTVAITVFAIAATALVVTLRNGIRTWERVNRVSDRQQQLRFALDLLERDATRAVVLTGANDTAVPPLFTERAMRFVTVQPPGGSQVLPRLECVLVQAETAADGTTALVRRSAPYPAVPEGPFGRAQILLTRISECRFAYVCYDAQTRHCRWQPRWGTSDKPPMVLPRGIQLTILGGADLPAPFTAVYGVPIGVPGPLEEPP